MDSVEDAHITGVIQEDGPGAVDVERDARGRGPMPAFLLRAHLLEE